MAKNMLQDFLGDAISNEIFLDVQEKILGVQVYTLVSVHTVVHSSTHNYVRS